MDKLKPGYKYTKDQMGILQFRKEILQKQLQNPSLKFKPVKIPSQPTIKTQNDQEGTILSNEFLQQINDTTSMRQSQNLLKQTNETKGITQFLPFIKERDNLGRLIQKEASVQQIQQNTQNVEANNKTDNNYKQLLNSLNHIKLKQQQNYKKDSQLCLNYMLNDFLVQQSLSHSMPTSSTNLNEDSPNMIKGFFVKQDKVKEYCSDINERTSPLLKDQKFKKYNQEFSSKINQQELKTKQHQQSQITHKRHSSDYTQISKNGNLSPQSQLVQKSLHSHNASQFINSIKNTKNQQFYAPQDQQKKNSQNAQQIWISYFDNIFHSKRYTPVSVKQITQQTNDSRNIYSNLGSQINLNEQEIIENSYKQNKENHIQKVTQYQSLKDSQLKFDNQTHQLRDESSKNMKQQLLDSIIQAQSEKNQSQIINKSVLKNNNINLSNLQKSIIVQQGQRYKSIDQNGDERKEQLNVNKGRINRPQSNKKMQQNYYLNNNNPKTMMTQQMQTEKDETFTQLFKGIKVQQSDIDKFVKNDLGYLESIQGKSAEEKIANFSQENVSSFINDIIVLKNRARKLKKTINQIPENAQNNLKDIESKFNHKYKFNFQF